MGVQEVQANIEVCHLLSVPPSPLAIWGLPGLVQIKDMAHKHLQPIFHEPSALGASMVKAALRAFRLLSHGSVLTIWKTLSS
jgi:hypothetical protein